MHALMTRWLFGIAMVAGCGDDPCPAGSTRLKDGLCHLDDADDADDGGDVGAAGWCDTAMDVTWGNFGEGFVLTHCQGCHAEDAPQRFGAPATVSFDDESDVLTNRSAMLRTILEAESMPPAGGLTDDEKLLVEVWLTCGI